MANWGVRISKPGFDVKTCTDDQLIMSSKFDLLKTSSSGTIAGTAAGTVTVAHGLSYQPIFFDMEQYGTATAGAYSLVGDAMVSTYVNGTALVFPNGNYKHRYYIFYQEVV